MILSVVCCASKDTVLKDTVGHEPSHKQPTVCFHFYEVHVVDTEQNGESIELLKNVEFQLCKIK